MDPQPSYRGVFEKPVSREVPAPAMASNPLITCRLPDGSTVLCLNRNEARFVYKEIFEERVYLRHGIEVKPDDCVFDVGANIGLFSIHVSQLCAGVRIHAFEPSPEVLPALQANLRRYPGAKIHACGLSDHEGIERFTFYPKCTILSGFATDSSRDAERLAQSIRQQLRARGQDTPGLEERHINWLVEDMLGGKIEYLCRLTTVSAVMRAERIETIHLLKIDAEGSELKILAGILSEDWQRIGQIEMEVHDARDGGLERAVDVLKAHGYDTAVEQTDELETSDIWQVYARHG